MKLLINLIVLFIVVQGTIAQERTVTVATLERNPLVGYYSEYAYTGTSSDRLIPTTRDTIDFIYTVRKTKLFDVSASVTMSPIAGADTTVTIAILGRNSTADSWHAITSGLSGVVSADDTFKEVTTYSSYNERAIIDTTLTSTALASTKDSLAFYVTNIVYSAVGYRYINIRLILTGNDSVGTGIQVDKVELKTYER